MQRAHRLRRRGDFAAVLRAGQRVTTPELALHYRLREDAGPARIGLSVSRRIGSAVVRNRTRRLLREAIRPLAPSLVVCDIVVAARPGIATLDRRDLESALTDAAGRAGLILSDT